jgi:uncharacterized protein with GYD domain
MATYVTTIQFTQQGLANLRDTCKRAAALKASARKMGVKITDIFWTMGAFDGLVVFDAPDEETATALMLHVASLGNVRTQTARAFTAAEMEKILVGTGP